MNHLLKAVKIKKITYYLLIIFLNQNVKIENKIKVYSTKMIKHNRVVNKINKYIIITVNKEHKKEKKWGYQLFQKKIQKKVLNMVKLPL